MTQSHDPFAPPAGSTPTAAPPTPQYTYGAPLYTVPPLKAHAGLGVASIVLAVTWTVVQVTQTALAPQAADAFADAADLGLSPIESAFTAYDMVGTLVLPVALAAYAVSGLWLYKSRMSAQGANPSFVHERGKVWAWLGWAVPVVNLWFPYQVVRDVRRATSPRPATGIGWWWAAWLVGYFVGESADKTSSRTSAGLTELASNVVVPLEVVSSIGMVVALVLWVRIVREVTAWQRERLLVQDGANSD
ncbi:uncharacterized protein DUF4328 [Promicromonospora sp. AC04]|uniref:DUF4328 domain-containing protein n=1 Tax=Promicromonospora sp. AC04 TaxID=2135723 RepID=UPI000D3C54D6|nr:DUF4328 domain-containing protein [Promicromonospora sp. AC04]PUB31676.1 uncharacterized protein DUF4328 [Promicromonospora sp. AC04]